MKTINTDSIMNLIIAVVLAVVFLVVGVALGPTVVYYFAQINSTSMENVTLGNVIVLFANYSPLFYYLGILGGAIMLLLAAIKIAKT